MSDNYFFFQNPSDLDIGLVEYSNHNTGALAPMRIFY